MIRVSSSSFIHLSLVPPRVRSRALLVAFFALFKFPSCPDILKRERRHLPPLFMVSSIHLMSVPRLYFWLSGLFLRLLVACFVLLFLILLYFPLLLPKRRSQKHDPRRCIGSSPIRPGHRAPIPCAIPPRPSYPPPPTTAPNPDS